MSLSLSHREAGRECPPAQPFGIYDNPRTHCREAWRLGARGHTLLSSYTFEFVLHLNATGSATPVLTPGQVWGNPEALPPDLRAGQYLCPYCQRLTPELRLCCGELHGQLQTPSPSTPRKETLL